MGGNNMILSVLLLFLQFFAQIIVQCPIELDLKPEEPTWGQTTNENRKRHFGVIEKWSTKLEKVLHGSTKRRKKVIEVEKFPLINYSHSKLAPKLKLDVSPVCKYSFSLKTFLILR